MKELMDLFTRFVVAVEKIADGGEECSDCKCETLLNPAKTEPIKDITRNYEAIADQPDGLPVLKQLCEKRGIDIQKGTRTKTIIKLLKNQDIFDELDKLEDKILVDTTSGQITTTLPVDYKVEIEPESNDADLTPHEEDNFQEEQHKDKVEIDPEDSDDNWGDEWPGE